MKFLFSYKLHFSQLEAIVYLGTDLKVKKILCGFFWVITRLEFAPLISLTLYNILVCNFVHLYHKIGKSSKGVA